MRNALLICLACVAVVSASCTECATAPPAATARRAPAVSSGGRLEMVPWRAQKRRFIVWSLLWCGPGEGPDGEALLWTASGEERRTERGLEFAGYSMRILASDESGISVPKRTGKNIEYL